MKETMFITNTLKGHVVEVIVGIFFIVIGLPIVTLYVIGHFCGILLDFLAKIENKIIFKII